MTDVSSKDRWRHTHYEGNMFLLFRKYDIRAYYYYYYYYRFRCIYVLYVLYIVFYYYLVLLSFFSSITV